MRRIFSKWTAVGLVVLAAAVMSAVATASSKAASIQVCVLLPETKIVRRAGCSSTLRTLPKALKAAGVTYIVTNALDDAQKQKAQADACLAAGAKVVIETAIDSGSAAAIEKSFTSKGGKAIDYDRQTLGGTASALRLLRQQARSACSRPTGVLAALKGKTKPVVAELWGGQTDTNAFLFKSGNDAVLNPLFKSGKLVEGPAAVRATAGSRQTAATDFAQLLVKTNNKIDGVIAANDNIAGAVVAHAQGQGPEADRAQRAGRDRRRACRTSSRAGRR